MSVPGSSCSIRAGPGLSEDGGGPDFSSGLLFTQLVLLTNTDQGLAGAGPGVPLGLCLSVSPGR